MENLEVGDGEQAEVRIAVETSPDWEDLRKGDFCARFNTGTSVFGESLRIGER